MGGPVSRDRDLPLHRHREVDAPYLRYEMITDYLEGALSRGAVSRLTCEPLLTAPPTSSRLSG
jgi:hypothetical protein